ncbi:hypothetical protein [uncultured Winogradskyella sp.]|uniref:hypothetical protein n=1 Tax=uncultured Winogradskyella sp. TaxID=395353 RepID=UPI0030EF8A13
MSKDIYTKVIEELMDKFFVEVEYNAETNRLVKIKGFTTGKLLDKYTNFTGC